MPMTNTEKVGFAQNVITFLNARKDELQAKGTDVTGLVAQLNAQMQAAVNDDDQQEAMKKALVTQTGKAVASSDALYDSASSTLDGAVGILGKKSEAGRQGQQLRSGIRRTKRTSSTVAPKTPAP